MSGATQGATTWVADHIGGYFAGVALTVNHVV